MNTALAITIGFATELEPLPDFVLAARWKNGAELWHSDGTQKGTVMIRAFQPGRRLKLCRRSHRRTVTRNQVSCQLTA